MTKRVLLALFALSCDGDPGPADAGGDDGGMDAGMIGDPDGGRDGGVDAGPPFDAGSDFRDFLAQLDGSVWSGLATRIEDGVEVERAFEMQFVGGAEPMWGEIRNPYGPARLRIRRFIRPAPAGCESSSICTVATTISIPDTSWETPPELSGRRETWRIEIIDGVTRALAIRNLSSGLEEIFDEGAWPEPTSGLTAEVRVYEGGSGHAISDAFCTSGGSQNRAAVWEFARGESTETVLAYDVVAGAPLRYWDDVENRFGVRDVEGFDSGTLGGSERTDQFYFTVRYTGVVEHPGGSFRMSESQIFDPTQNDDDFEDAIFAFVGSDVGSTFESDLFFEVHGFAWPDATTDEPSTSFSAGDVDVEIVVLRCMMTFGSRDLGVALSLGGAPYEFFTDQPTRPTVDTTLFPPVL